MFCSNCGNKLADGVRFCSFCGTKVAEPAEQDIRTVPGFKFKEPEIESSSFKFPADRIIDEAPEKPVRERMAFDWSNVVDEPRKRKEVADLRSPWDTAEEKVEKKPEVRTEKAPDHSRTMSFLDVLKAERLEKEKAAADKAIEYTEVLDIKPELSAFDEAPKLHFAPLYDDVDEHVVSPFDKKDTIKSDILKEAPALETFAPIIAETASRENTELKAETAKAPAEPEIRLSRETIAEFDEYVKSFEKEAGIIGGEVRTEKPVIKETPASEDPAAAYPKFELPDFLKGFGIASAGSAAASEKSEPAAEAKEPAYVEPRFEKAEPKEAVFDEPAFEEATEEPAFEEPVFEETEDEPAFDEPEFEEPAFEESAFDEPVFEDAAEDDLLFDEPVFEKDYDDEPSFDEAEAMEPAFEEPRYDSSDVADAPAGRMEDDYLSMGSGRADGSYAAAGAEAEDQTAEAADGSEAGAAPEAGKPETYTAASSYDAAYDNAAYDNNNEESTSFEDELFMEMGEARPHNSGMTIAEPAGTESEIESLKRRLAELTGNTPDTADYADKESEDEKADFRFKTIAAAEVETLFTEDASVDGTGYTAESDPDGAVSLEDLFNEEPEYDDVTYEEAKAKDETGISSDHAADSRADDLFEGLAPEGRAASESQIEDAYLFDSPLFEAPVLGLDDLGDEESPAAERSAAERPSTAPSFTDYGKEEAEEPSYASSGVIGNRVQRYSSAPAGSAAWGSADASDASDVSETADAPEEALTLDDLFRDLDPVPESTYPADEGPAADQIQIYDEYSGGKHSAGRRFADAPANISAQEEVPAAQAEPAQDSSVDDILRDLAAMTGISHEPAAAAAETAVPLYEESEEAAESAAVRASAPESAPVSAPTPVPVFREEPPAKSPEEQTIEAALDSADAKSSDALSLEELEINLFGEAPSAEVEAEETKKIDKFYTLYRKNEEFQRLLDEEYDKLRNGGTEEKKETKAETPETPKTPAPAPVRIEDNKAYRQVEDETIYMPREVVEEQAKAEMAAAAPAAVSPAVVIDASPASKPVEFKASSGEIKAPVEIESGDVSYKKNAGSKKAAKEAAKAEKARLKEERRRERSGHSAGKEEFSASEVEYEDVDAGSGILTVLAILIALILVVLLAVILILQIAPDSSAAAWINELIGRITQSIGDAGPYDGMTLL